MFKKMIAMAAFAVSATFFAEEVVPDENIESDSFLDWLKKGELSLNLSNFTSAGKAEDDNYALVPGAEGDILAYSNTVFSGLYETPVFGKLQLGIGFYAHTEILDKEDVYDNRFPTKGDVYLRDLYLRYLFNDEAYFQIGQYNVRDRHQRFDMPWAEGALFSWTPNDKLSLEVGVVRQLAFFFDDIVVDYEDVDNPRWNRLEDPENEQDVGGEIFYYELSYQATDTLMFKPYTYHQEDHVTWYGLDTELRFQNDWGKYGMLYYMYYLEMQADDSLIDDNSNSFNYSVIPFVHLGNWEFYLGYAHFGDNETFNNPGWGYRYLTNVLYQNSGGSFEVIDYNSLYGQKGTDVYFGSVGYKRDRWSCHLTAGFYRPEKYDGHNLQDKDLWEIQLGGGYQITDSWNIGGRLVSIISDEMDTSTTDRDAHYFELWTGYTF